MPRARTRRGRLRQVENWLSNLFPPPRRTIVKVVDMKPGKSEMVGGSDRVGKEIHIRIHSKLTFSQAADALFEEWAHAVAWPFASQEHEIPHHDESWGSAYQKIRHQWDDLTGQADSMDYPEA